MKSFKYILVLFFLASLASCSSSSGNWGWYVIDPTTKSGLANIKFLIGGFGATILLSIIAAFISIILECCSHRLFLLTPINYFRKF